MIVIREGRIAPGTRERQMKAADSTTVVLKFSRFMPLLDCDPITLRKNFLSVRMIMGEALLIVSLAPNRIVFDSFVALMIGSKICLS